MDVHGNTIRLRCVNWYGAHMEELHVAGLGVQRLGVIVHHVVALGFNCVRLPYALDTQLSGRRVAATTLAANPELVNRSSLELLDATVKALGNAGLMVVLNNHQGRAMWCCSEDDGEGLWYTEQYSEDAWVNSLAALAARYRALPHAVAMDIRNEPRKSHGVAPEWGTGGPQKDWAAAAQRAAVAVLAVNPNILIIVEGLDFATDLSGMPAKPLHLTEGLVGHVMYEVHDYTWFHGDLGTAEFLWYWCVGSLLLHVACVLRPRLPHYVEPKQLRRLHALLLCCVGLWSCWLSSYANYRAGVSAKWGYMLEEGPEQLEAPLWLGEFGTNGPGVTDNWWMELGEASWWAAVTRLTREHQLHFAYWALNGDKRPGEEETFGILRQDYATIRQPRVVRDLLQL
eukprot:NODE_6927_length_1625_cov_3.707610.p1 GENE.NODE_6927_length_1625_cov_3.707610~~NODE_6927_length_1625_cov_3.707610.p1  ORF type:complete len:399 (-),score=78.16 NODE_6927_length_1625_cov_3.707610:228-1424(-)